MDTERFHRTPYEAPTTPPAKLGYEVPKIKLISQKNSGLSTPTLERLAQLQNAAETGYVILPHQSTHTPESALIQSLPTEIAQAAQAVSVPPETLIPLTRIDPNIVIEDEDEHKTFGLGSALRRAQGIVVSAYSVIDKIKGLTRDDLDRLLVGLGSSDTHDRAMQEIQVLEPILKEVNKRDQHH